jgi:hypothetical protein
MTEKEAVEYTQEIVVEALKYLGQAAIIYASALGAYWLFVG